MSEGEGRMEVPGHEATTPPESHTGIQPRHTLAVGIDNLATAKKRKAHCSDDTPKSDRPIPRSKRAPPNPTPTGRGERIAALVDSLQSRKRRVPSHGAIQVRDYLDPAEDIRPDACVGLRSGLES